MHIIEWSVNNHEMNNIFGHIFKVLPNPFILPHKIAALQSLGYVKVMLCRYVHVVCGVDKVGFKIILKDKRLKISMYIIYVNSSKLHENTELYSSSCMIQKK